MQIKYESERGTRCTIHPVQLRRSRTNSRYAHSARYVHFWKEHFWNVRLLLVQRTTKTFIGTSRTLYEEHSCPKKVMYSTKSYSTKSYQYKVVPRGLGRTRRSDFTLYVMTQILIDSWLFMSTLSSVRRPELPELATIYIIVIYFFFERKIYSNLKNLLIV